MQPRHSQGLNVESYGKRSIVC